MVVNDLLVKQLVDGVEDDHCSDLYPMVATAGGTCTATLAVVAPPRRGARCRRLGRPGGRVECWCWCMRDVQSLVFVCRESDTDVVMSIDPSPKAAGHVLELNLWHITTTKTVGLGSRTCGRFWPRRPR
jgi:hypothetical protein